MLFYNLVKGYIKNELFDVFVELHRYKMSSVDKQIKRRFLKYIERTLYT